MMTTVWTDDWRERVWATIEQPWDLVIIGGGITGAGILHDATHAGLRTLLVEQHDFGSGASCRSSKLVHGGFRYLGQGRLAMVRDAVRERRRLLAEGAGLVRPVGFMLASYRGDRPAPWVNQVLLALYDLLAGQWNHQRHDPATFAMMAPHVAQNNLVAGLRSIEATVDDARLVLRVVREGVAAGGKALNYVRATALLRDQDQVIGVRLHDLVGDRMVDVRATAVINATGAWGDRLRAVGETQVHLRPLRGSHLVFPGWRLPVAQVIAFRHPLDGRYVSVVPWEGVSVLGTTDLDYREPLDDEPAITPDEVAYLMAAAEAVFPSLALTLDDVVATYSGVRPVVDSGERDPSRESREHLILEERGLITAMGGKLTTFRLVAHDTLKVVQESCGNVPEPDRSRPTFRRAPDRLDAALPRPTVRRLLGRYGRDAAALVAAAQPGEL